MEGSPLRRIVDHCRCMLAWDIISQANLCLLMLLSAVCLYLQEEFDTHDPKAHNFLKLPFLKKRSRIVEIVAARDTVFALTHSGVCAAFSRGLRLAAYVNR